MVLVVKWLRPRIVIPIYVGSNPIMHPRMSSIMVVRLLHTESGGSSTLLSSTKIVFALVTEFGIRTGLRNQVLRVRVSPRAPCGLVSIVAVRKSPKLLAVVRFHHESPKIWAVGIVGNTVALQASVPGSNPGRSTINLEM